MIGYVLTPGGDDWVRGIELLPAGRTHVRYELDGQWYEAPLHEDFDGVPFVYASQAIRFDSLSWAYV